MRMSVLLAIKMTQTYSATVSRAMFLFAMLAIVSLMTIPFGYMPAKAQDGSVILRICDGSVPMPQQTHSPHDQHHDHHDHHTMANAEGNSAATDDAHAEHEDGAHEMRCNYAVAAAANLPEAPDFVRQVPQETLVKQTRLAILTAIFPPKMPPSTGPPDA